MAKLVITRNVRQSGEKNKDGAYIHPAVAFTITLDTANVTPEQILALAADQCAVGVQAEMRRTFAKKDNKEKFPAIVSNVAKSFNLKTYIESQRAPGKSAFEKVRANMDKLTPDQRAEMLRLLNKK